MPVTVQTFRQTWPAFTSTVMYPDATITFWLNYAYMFLSPRRWRCAIDLGAMLFTAHNITLDALSAAEGQNGAPPGMTVGPIQTKTVRDLTITYDVAHGVNEADAHWALTNWGTRLIKLARQFGSGPVQIGFGFTPIGQGPFYPMGPGWPGPMFENFSD